MIFGFVLFSFVAVNEAAALSSSLKIPKAPADLSSTFRIAEDRSLEDRLTADRLPADRGPPPRPVADRIAADRTSKEARNGPRPFGQAVTADRLPADRQRVATLSADRKAALAATSSAAAFKTRSPYQKQTWQKKTRQKKAHQKSPPQKSLLREGRKKPFFQPLLSLPFSKKPLLKPHIIQNTQPLISGERVIQGDVFEGVKAFHRASGRLLWEAKGIETGSAFVFHGNRLYFGGSDGFFYALEADTGRLVWKFSVGSENISAPVLFQGAVYWQSSHQKIYARETAKKGRILWTYAGPPLPQKGFFERPSGGLAIGRGGAASDKPASGGDPAADPTKSGAKNKGRGGSGAKQGRGGPGGQTSNGVRLFGGFHDGSLVALDLKTGKKLWSLPSRSLSSISFRLRSRKGCLLVPWRDLGLFCLNRRNGKVLWKAPGGLAHPAAGPGGRLYQAQKGRIYALHESDGRILWSKKREDAAGDSPASAPVFFTPYKKFVIYGSPASGVLVAADADDGRSIGRFLFGKGLASPVTVLEEENEAWFFSIQGRLHKIRLNY